MAERFPGNYDKLNREPGFINSFINFRLVKPWQPDSPSRVRRPDISTAEDLDRKARQITIGTPVGSQVALVTKNLLDRTRIDEAVRRAGLEPVMLADRAAVERALAETAPSLALVDLQVDEGERIIRLLATAGVKVTVFGPHVDEAALERARAAGAAEALPRSLFFSRLPRIFET